MNRRTFLIQASSAGAIGLTSIGASAGQQGTDNGSQQERDEPTAQTQPIEPESAPFADEFDTVLNVVDEGIDPSGEEPATVLFEEHMADDTLFVFPPGIYRFDQVDVYQQSHVGLVAAGDGRVTFIPSEGDCFGGHPYYRFEAVSDLRIDGIDFDFTNADSGGAIHLFLTGDSIVRNSSIVGSCANQLSVSRMDVRDEEGTARINMDIKNVDAHRALTAIFIGEPHAGEITFEECTVEGFSDNGLYASSPGMEGGADGTVNVVGGTFKNNNIANIRLGTTGSRAEDVSIRVDSGIQAWGRRDSRGIRLRSKQGQVIQGCDIVVTEAAAESSGAIIFHHENHGATVRDTYIQIDRDNIRAITALPVEGASDSEPVFDGVTICGAAEEGMVAYINGRDRTTFRNCMIQQRAGDRMGCYLIDSADCRFVDCYIETAGPSMVLDNASATLENVMLVTPDGHETITERTVENEVVAPE